MRTLPQHTREVKAGLKVLNWDWSWGEVLSTSKVKGKIKRTMMLKDEVMKGTQPIDPVMFVLIWISLPLCKVSHILMSMSQRHIHTKTLNSSVHPRSYGFKMTAQGWLYIEPDHTSGRFSPIYSLERMRKLISTPGGAKKEKPPKDIYFTSIDACHKNYGFTCHQLLIHVAKGKRKMSQEISVKQWHR